MTTTRIKDGVKFEKSISMLDEILGRQISPSDETGLGYDSSLKSTSSAKLNTKLSVEEEEGRSRNCNEELQEHNTSNKNTRLEFMKVETPRRSFSTKYEDIFLGHCYDCGNFGHKAIHYRAYVRNNYMRNINDYGYPKDNHVNNRPRNDQGLLTKITIYLTH